MRGELCSYCFDEIYSRRKLRSFKASKIANQLVIVMKLCLNAIMIFLNCRLKSPSSVYDKNGLCCSIKIRYPVMEPKVEILVVLIYTEYTFIHVMFLIVVGETHFCLSQSKHAAISMYVFVVLYKKHSGVPIVQTRSCHFVSSCAHNSKELPTEITIRNSIHVLDT